MTRCSDKLQEVEWQTLVESLKSNFISSPVEFDSIHFKQVVLAMFNTSFRRSQYRGHTFKTLKHLKFDTTGFCSDLLPNGRFATRTLENGSLEHLYTYTPSLRAQTALCGVVALRYQHHDNDNEVPQLHTTQSAPLD